jgi:sugar phosphate isomerase/epimerase
MHIAISSLLFKSLNLGQVIDRARDMGVSWLEVWTEHFWRDDDGRMFDRLLRSGLDLSVHGPTGDVNVTSANKGIRAESIRQVLLGVEEAARMGAQVITVHPGYLTGRQDEPDSIWDYQIEALAQITKRGKDVGIRVAMETMEKRNNEVVIDPATANRIIDAVNMENLGVTFDISHAHTVMNVVDFIRSLRRITHIHISDAKNGKVHVQMGEGEIDFAEVLLALKEKYDGALVVEGWNPRDEAGMVQKSITFLNTQLAELAGPEKIKA